MHMQVRLGEHTKYRSAGTVEFLVDDDTGEFYFLEVHSWFLQCLHDPFFSDPENSVGSSDMGATGSGRGQSSFQTTTTSKGLSCMRLMMPFILDILVSTSRLCCSAAAAELMSASAVALGSLHFTENAKLNYAQRTSWSACGHSSGDVFCYNASIMHPIRA